MGVLPRISDHIQNLHDHSNANNMTEKEIDQYLDFCQDALLPQRNSNGGSRFESYYSANYKYSMRTLADDTPILNSYFGLHADFQLSKEIEELSPHVHWTMDANVVMEEERLRPGQAYPIYNSRDSLGTMPRSFEQALKHGANWIVVDCEYVGRVLEMFERRLLRWWKLRKRKLRERARKPGEIDLDLSDSEMEEDILGLTQID